MMRRGSLWLIALLFLLLKSVGYSQTEQKRYTFAIVPQQAASRTDELWGPLLQYISNRTGIQLQLVTKNTIPDFEALLAKGIPDFAYMNPFHYVYFHQKSGYESLVHAKNLFLRGIIVVAKDSPLQHLHELQGKSIAFPSESAFAATIIPLRTLASMNITVTPHYVGSHDSVYLNVAKGFFVAGGGVVQTLQSTNPTTQSQLRIVWQSPNFTPHPITVHPRVPVHVANAIRQALLEIDTTESGKALLAPLKMQGFVTSQDTDWDDIRKLNLNLTIDTSTKRVIP